jgi:hypothetical protein
MELKLNHLKEYARMTAEERQSERGKSIRAELIYRMRWMPKRWRKLVRCRYILRYSAVRTGIEIHVSERTVRAWTKEIAEWLEDTDKYLEELT